MDEIASNAKYRKEEQRLKFGTTKCRMTDISNLKIAISKRTKHE